LSLRRLDGWTPTATTDYEYDDAGRLARSTTTSDSEWDEEQEAWFLALADYRASRCPCGCGEDRRESMDIKNDGRYKATAAQCHARAAIDIASKQYEKEPFAGSLLFGVELRR
jgi:hypothetical protein